MIFFKQKNGIFICILIIFLASCKSIYFSDFRPNAKNKHILPTLETQVDIWSIEHTYTNGTSVSTGLLKSYNIDGSYISAGSAVTVHYPDSRVQDVITLFDHEVKENITDPYGPKYGYLTMKISNGGGRMAGIPLYALSLITGCIPNLFGMSFFTVKTDIELQVEILDSNKNLIARYIESGYKKVPVALYRGYSERGAYRKSNIEAVKNAFNKIKLKIDSDYDKILKKLKEAGEIK